MIQIGACQTECSLVSGQCNPSPAAKILATLAAGRIPARDEYLYVCALLPLHHFLKRKGDTYPFRHCSFACETRSCP